MKKTTLLSKLKWHKKPTLGWNAFYLFMLTFCLGQLNAQTVLINPAAEGGFENGTTLAANGWTALDDVTNKWSLGTAPGWFTGNRGAYISTDGGTTWNYNATSTSRSFFYRDVAFPVGATSVNLSFDWRGNGNDGNYDNLMVYIIDTNITPSNVGPTGTNTTTTGWTGYTNGTTGYYLLQRAGTVNPTTTTAVTYAFTTAQMNYVSGKTKRLLFVWKNDSSDGENPPASLDNISLTSTVPTCFAPTAVTTSAVTKNSATLSWTAPATAPANGYQYEVRSSGAAGSGATGLGASGTSPAGVVTQNATGLAPSTTYTVYVRSSCGGSDFSAWAASATFTTKCDYFDITGTTPGTVCGTGTATLSATAAGGVIGWYAAQTGGTALGTGPSFTTPVISATTSYWVETAVPGSTNVGPISPTAQGGTIGTQTIEWDVSFTVLQNTKLVSIDIFPQTTGQTGSIAVRNSSGTVIATYPYTTNVGGGATAQTITLNHTLAPGSYQLYPTLPSGGVSRNVSGAVYPYTSAAANITGNGYDPTYFMGFYNWKFDLACASVRTEVVATVTSAPAITLSANSTTAVCSGQTSSAITLATGGLNYDTYTWSPATGVTGDATNGWTFNPTATTTYTLTASQSAGSCATTATVVVNINPNPVVNVTATPATICQGTSSTIAATTQTVAPGTITIGTGTSLTGDTTQPTAFCNRWAQYWNQTVFTAAELTAAGLKPGNITSIAYRITSLGSGTNVTNFTVRIGTTTASTMTAFTTTGLNLVYGPATYTHAVGLNTITFTTPYVWDGVSNIILDIRQDGADLTYNAITYYTATADNTTASATTSTPSATTVLATTNPTPALSKNRLNVVFGGQTASTGAGDLTWNWMPGNLSGNSVSVSPATTTTYTVRGTNPTTGCYTESTITVNVTPAPAAPTGNATQVINVNTPAEATIASLVATGTAVVWYPTEADALANTNALATTTQLVSGTTYYAMQTVGGCRSIAPLAVTATVTLGTGSFNMPGLKYYPNPVIDVFTVTYTNDITSVEVFNLVGQRVIAVQPNATTVSVDMSVLPTGAYILQVKANGQSQSVKVIKK
ncbi:Ig-like domain-containing protein [Flavobacterium cerinum]|uniref:T9SS type A sorting domain-containing protein n=1 Tax=Flavobacterium cerinum TaxID=2502784 RepID=A0ABY5IS79_9FLAO|nr:T9SS type A sorting domain-containing protein [Flavobacterium cerinum]UUC45639.1 T9SS type A sorting domain-containing protein [Flavobacterium cerinum]